MGGRALLGGWLLLASSHALAQPTADDRALFPVAPGGWFVIEGERSALLSDGARLAIRLVRFEPPEGQGFMNYSRWCGVVVRQRGRPPQALITIGTGETEVLNCAGLNVLGALPTRGRAQRLGLVYRAGSPNTFGLVPAILVRDAPNSAWRLDEALAERLADRGATTLQRMRAALPRLVP